MPDECRWTTQRGRARKSDILIRNRRLQLFLRSSLNIAPTPPRRMSRAVLLHHEDPLHALSLPNFVSTSVLIEYLSTPTHGPLSLSRLPSLALNLANLTEARRETRSRCIWIGVQGEHSLSSDRVTATDLGSLCLDRSTAAGSQLFVSVPSPSR